MMMMLMFSYGTSVRKIDSHLSDCLNYFYTSSLGHKSPLREKASPLLLVLYYVDLTKVKLVSV